MTTLRPMLACDAPQRIKFPVYASAKLDGIRGITHECEILSRSMKPIPNRFVQTYFTYPHLAFLDGELIVGDPNDKNAMQNTSSGIMSRNGEPDFTYWVFDVWGTDENYERRLNLLKKGLEHPSMQEFTRIRLLPQVYVLSDEELQRFEQKCLDEGFEGVITRNPASIYKHGRSTPKEQSLLKVKRFADSEAVIIGVEELMHNGNTAQLDPMGYTIRSSHQDNKVPMDTLGSLRVSWNGLEFNIGTGYSMEKRFQLWKMWKAGELIGRLAKFKHFEVGVKIAPRFPVFLGIRDLDDL